MLGLFIAAFVTGSLLVSGPHPSRMPGRAGLTLADTQWAQRCLIVASLMSLILLMSDVASKNLLDFNTSAEMRTKAAEALLHAAPSKSSLWFRLAFLLYPAGYIIIALEIIYRERPRVWMVLVLGLMPSVLAALSMGGRMPILYAALIFGLSMCERHRLGIGKKPSSEPRSRLARHVIWVGVCGAALVLMVYFGHVFMVRATLAGGADQMFEIAAERWGVGFSGWMSHFFIEWLGMDVAYLIFVFVWYSIQGLLISNVLFTSYEGPMQWGAYGIDLVSALMRRLDSATLAKGFDALLEINVYGFFPSAWGSLYVDLGLFALAVVLVWGLLSALVYRRALIEQRIEWSLLWPFIVAGIGTSLINTPIGFSNGLVTHFWLILAFVLLRQGKPPLMQESR